MRRPSLLSIYAAVTTTLLGAAFVTDAVGRQGSTSFDTLDVQRINVREVDGTLRLVIANTSRFPGLIIRGQEHPHDRDTAGLLFFNNEETENGGLIFGGRRKADGSVENFGHLSFDQFEQDQVLALSQGEEDGARTAGLTIYDRPDVSMTEIMRRTAGLTGAAREAEVARLRAEGLVGQQRAFFGKTEARASSLDLKDADGRTRLRLHVAADGAASIQFLDATGAVTRTVTPEG
jgi:hypothetical protein